MVGTRTHIQFLTGYEELLNETTASSTKEGTGKPILGRYGLAILDVTGVPAAYTDETLNVKIQVYDKVSDTWFDTTYDGANAFSFAEISDTIGSELINVSFIGGNCYRAVATIAGTAPDYDFTVSFIWKR